MEKFFSYLEHYATGEGRFINITGGNFSDQEALEAYLKKHIDPYFLKAAQIYSSDDIPSDIFEEIKKHCPDGVNSVLQMTGIHYFMYETYTELG